MDKTLEERFLGRDSVILDVWYYFCAYVVYILHIAFLMLCIYIVFIHVFYERLCIGWYI